MKTEQIVADLVQRIENRFFGKYRGFVVDNADPEQLGRLKLRVPSVLGGDIVTGWALPCVPYGGDANQGFLFIPEVGAGVWVEFEEGDLEFPLWVGTFWSKPGDDSELPKPNDPDGTEQGSVQDAPTRKIIKTLKGHTLQFEDADGGELITLVDGANGHVVTLDASGISVTDGKNGHKITLDAAGIVVSDGANSDNQVVMDATGLTVQDKNGNQIIMGPGGIQVGSSGAVESLVLGTTLAANVASFLISLSTHTHVGNLGAPTSPPVAPMQLQVPLSPKHKTE
ncbi:MAG TPA: phage baseplate assembly protein V [Micromonosporaceae bacterium]